MLFDSLGQLLPLFCEFCVSRKKPPNRRRGDAKRKTKAKKRPGDQPKRHFRVLHGKTSMESAAIIFGLLGTVAWIVCGFVVAGDHRIWAGIVAIEFYVLAGGCTYQQLVWNQRANEEQTSAPAAPMFSARVKTTIKQTSIDDQPSYVAVFPLADQPIAYGISATMYLQLRNTTQSACMIDSYSVEAKSDRGNWEVMRIADVPGPGGELGGEHLYWFDDPKQAKRMEPGESFTDAVKKRNLQPGETIQGLIFLTMPQDWMAGEYRIRIVDSAGEESLVPIAFDTAASNATLQAQVASFKCLETGVDISAYTFVRPGRSAE